MPAAGYCQCGCGAKTRPVEKTSKREGVRKGDPRRYLPGHYAKHQQALRPSEMYVETDCGYETKCWLWTHAGGRYGHTRKGRGLQVAHRMFYEEHHGPIPNGHVLDHLCENTRCVNPDHLEPVQQPENCRRGRSAKLNWDKVDAIRASGDSAQELARRYGVCKQTIYQVLAKRTWFPDTRTLS